MYAVLAEESLTRPCSNTESTMNAKDSPCLHAHNLISNSAILNNNCFVAKWFVCMRTSFENGVCNVLRVQFRAFSMIGYYNINSTDNLDNITSMRKTTCTCADPYTKNEHYITLHLSWRVVHHEQSTSSIEKRVCHWEGHWCQMFSALTPPKKAQLRAPLSPLLFCQTFGWGEEAAVW